MKVAKTDVDLRLMVSANYLAFISVFHCFQEPSADSRIDPIGLRSGFGAEERKRREAVILFPAGQEKPLLRWLLGVLSKFFSFQ
jgi:hypothetical protein